MFPDEQRMERRGVMAEKKSTVMGRKRSRILYEITALVVILMVASGLAIFIFVNNAFDRMVEKSVDKVVDEKAQTIHTGLGYISQSMAEKVMGDISSFTQEQLAEMNRAMVEGKPSQFTVAATESLKQLVEEKVLGLELVVEVDPDDLIIITTDDSLAFTELPQEVLSAVEEAEDEGKTYVYMEDGMPALGLEGEYLMSFYDMSQVTPILRGYRGFHFVSMHETVAEINDFYNSEKDRATLSIGLIVGGSVLLAIIIIFFVLSYLIRRQITDPIDALVSASGEVMEGNLDVEVEVHEGGDFESLERAFKEMVNSIREYIAKSTGEG